MFSKKLAMKLTGLAMLSTGLTTSVQAGEGFIIQDKPSAQCSIHLCDEINGPSYAEDGSIIRPTGWESWIFIGSPLTPDELNGGKATFREFHSVYIEPSAFNHYKNTGEFPNKTQMVKVRTNLYEGEECKKTDKKTGACLAVSGWGYFNGEYSGFELTVKDTTRFKDPGGWVYLNYGEERPWDATSNPFPAAACNSCHEKAAGDDFVFTQFYPVLRDNDPKRFKGSKAAAMTKKKTKSVAPAQLAAVKSPVPVDDKKLFKYLRSGKYKNFATHDKEMHPSAGPHLDYGQPVKVYFSDEVAKSLKGGHETHPKGSALVKELYSENGKKLLGWAVSVKTEEKSDGGDGWFWVEYMSTTDSSKKPAPAGNGVALCAGCHTSGSDYVLSHLPK